MQNKLCAVRRPANSAGMASRSVLVWCLVAALVAVFAFSHFRAPVAPGGIAPGLRVKPVSVKPELVAAAEARKLALEQKKLLSDVRLRTEKFKADVQAAVLRYEGMIPLADADRDFGAARQGIDFLASREGLCGFKASCSLAYKLAYDQVKGTTRAHDAIVPVVEASVLGPVERAVGKYEALTRQFDAALRREAEAFALDLAVRAQAFEAEIAVLSSPEVRRLDGAMQDLVAKIGEHAVKTATATVEAAVEAALIRSTVSAIGKVVARTAGRVLAGAAAKLGGSVAAGVGCAVADGPIPVGDIIGAGIAVIGLGLTAYDIYDAMHVMPGEIRASAGPVLDATRATLAANARNNLHGLRDSVLAFADQQAAAIEKSLR